jgi:hypothetical protein
MLFGIVIESIWQLDAKLQLEGGDEALDVVGQCCHFDCCIAVPGGNAKFDCEEGFGVRAKVTNIPNFLL